MILDGLVATSGSALAGAGSGVSVFVEGWCGLAVVLAVRAGAGAAANV